MSDLVNIATAAAANLPAATAAGTSSVIAIKAAKPYLDALLKPAAEQAGVEIKAFIKEKAADWKKARQEEKLRRNIEGAKAILEERLPEPPPIENINPDRLLEWVEGAQEVDPEDSDLAKIWQELLARIATGEKVEKMLIDTLRSLSAAEASVLLRPQGFDGHFSKEETYFLKALERKGILTLRWRPLFFLAVLLSNWGLSQILGRTIAYVLYSVLNEANRTVITVTSSERFDSPLKTSADFVSSMDYPIFFAIAPLMAYFIHALVEHKQPLIKRWRLTWLGERILKPIEKRNAPADYKSRHPLPKFPRQ